MRYYRNYGAKNINLAPIDDLVKVLPTQEQTGKIVTFNSPFAGLPLKSCKVNIPVVQEGTGDPSPDNVRAISGFDSVVITRCGKNLINLSDVYNSSGYIYNRAPIFLKSGTYVFSVDISAKGGQTLALRKDNTEYFRLDFTSNIGRNVIIFTISGEVNNISLYSGVSATFTDFQIEKGDMVSEFEAYNGNTYTFPFGQTIYAGELDVLTGIFTATHKLVDLGDLSWGSLAISSAYAFVSDVIYDMQVVGNVTTIDSLCSSYPLYMSGNGSVMVDKSYRLGGTYAGVKRISVRDDDYTSVSDFKSAVTGVQVFYPLATPEVINLGGMEIATLQGENNLFASTGDTTVQYFKK